MGHSAARLVDHVISAVRVQAHERGRLERLCRYVTRPALADARIELDGNGQVRLRLKFNRHAR